MKKCKWLLALIVCTNLSAQDLITTRKGEDIKAKILEVGVNDIKYKKFDNLDGPLFTVLKTDILIIRYENGSKELFDAPVAETPTVAPSNQEMTMQGERDAQRYYRGYRGYKVGTFFPCIVIGPLFGLIPAGFNSHAEIKEKHLINNAQPDLFKNPQYRDAYVYKAKRIKNRKVWGGYVSGSIICVAILVALVGAGY